MMEKIVHTAKQTVKASVLIPSAVLRPTGTVVVCCITRSTIIAISTSWNINPIRSG